MFTRVLKINVFLLIIAGQICTPSVYRNPSVEQSFVPTLLTRKKSGEHSVWMSFGYANASNSFDEFGQTGPLFACFGPSDFYQFVKLHKLFPDGSVTSNFIQNLCAAKDPNNSQSLYSPMDQLLYLDGKVDLVKMQIDGFFDFKNGFAASAQIPLIFSNCRELKFVTLNGEQNIFSALVNKGNTAQNIPSINDVLTENGISRLDQDYSVASFGDSKVGLVWCDNFKSKEEWAKVNNIAIGIGIHFIIPTSLYSGYSKQFLYSVPVGDNGSFGINVQMDAEINFIGNFSLLLCGEHRVFLQQNLLIRPKLFSRELGLLFAKPVHLWFDNGHYWKGFIGAKVEVPNTGSSCFAGYFYESKEATQLYQSDQELTAGSIFNLVTESPPSTASITTIYCSQPYVPAVINPVTGLADPAAIPSTFTNEQPAPTTLHDSMVNSERSLQRQYAHWICFGITTKNRRLGVKAFESDLSFSLSYAYPIFGKNRFVFNTWSGYVGASTTINF